MDTGSTQPAHENLFERFIDKFKSFTASAKPLVIGLETAAVDAEPLLALSPAGPEYAIAVNAIVGANQIAAATMKAGATLSNEQKVQIAINAATPALNTILTSKGVSTDTEQHIATWIQNIFNILAGPVAKVVADIEGALHPATAK